MANVTEATVKCPKCGEPVPLTEALAAPLLAARQREFDVQLAAEKRAAADARQAAEALAQEARADAANLTREREALELEKKDETARINAEVARRTRHALHAAEQQAGEQLAAETKRIAADEERRAANRVRVEMDDKNRELKDMSERVAAVMARLETTQAGELAALQAKRAAEDAFKELELRKQREFDSRLNDERAKAIELEAGKHALALGDKDRIIRDMTAKLEDATRKGTLGSQQAQGETLEEQLETQLRRRFVYDTIEPVAKGVSGADVLQVVRDEMGRECGRILWESKRTQHWQASWLSKLKTDQRAAQANIAVLISQAMPPDVQHFNEVDGVWVSSIACIVPVAVALRSSLIQLGSAIRANEGMQSKAELIYQYVNGPQFSNVISALVEQWQEMGKDLADEKKTALKRWARREKQIELLLATTTGVYGHIQAIAGRELKTIDALEEPRRLEE